MLFRSLVPFAVYLSTLNPSLFRNDSPETITACLTLGVSHPPGYPLHSLLGRLFSLTRVGNPAMTLNLLSAFISAFGVWLFFLNAWRLLTSLGEIKGYQPGTGWMVVALAASLGFAFSRNYWSSSLAAKGGIYNLQMVLELAFLFFLQPRLHKRKSAIRKGSFFLTFLFGLGLANHWPTQALLLPALVLATLAAAHPDISFPLKSFQWKRLWVSTSLLVMPLSLYLYLPLRSHLYPVLNFWAPCTLERFVSSLFRLEYFKIETMASFIPTAFSTIESKGPYIAARFWTELGAPFAILAFAGVFLLWRNGNMPRLLFLLVLLATTLVANLFYLQVMPIDFWHLDDHLLTVNWITALLGMAGLYWAGTFSHTIGLSLAFLVPAVAFWGNHSLNDQRKEFLFQGYGMAALQSMARGAFYFAETDYDYFSILYLTEAERKRPDVGLTLTTFWKRNYWADLMRHQYGTRFAGPHPIYCCFPNGDFMKENLSRGITAPFTPTGTVVELRTAQSAKNSTPELQPLRSLWDQYLLPGRRSTHSIDGMLLKLCAHPYLNMAQYLALRGDHLRRDELETKGLSLDPSLDPGSQK